MRKYTPEQVARIKELYPNTSNKEIVAELGISIRALYNLAFSNGLKKDADFLLAQNRELVKKLAESGVAYRYKKGQSPPNKGRKQTEYMSAENIAKTAATRFKKGHSPHNHCEVGTYRTTKEGYLECKTAEPSTWQLAHRMLWELHNGAIPSGMIVIFIDGDKTNLKIENLQLISMKENIQRNSHHAAADLTDEYIAIKIAKKDTDLKNHLISTQHPIIATKRAAMQLNRRIKEVFNNTQK